MEMVGHMLTHSWDDLKSIGISDELVRKYITERHPRKYLEEMRQAEIQSRYVQMCRQPGTCYPMSTLLMVND
jgi:hypothetical protein